LARSRLDLAQPRILENAARAERRRVDVDVDADADADADAASTPSSVERARRYGER
jgi:hypothetical protein